MTNVNRVCGRCGGALEAGFATARGLMGGDRAATGRPQLHFIVPGTPTDTNLARAFRQGLEGERAARIYGIAGFRCTKCGALELFADAD